MSETIWSGVVGVANRAIRSARDRSAATNRHLRGAREEPDRKRLAERAREQAEELRLLEWLLELAVARRIGQPDPAPPEWR